MSKKWCYNEDKAKGFINYIQIHGEQKTCYDWNMKPESLARRLREIKSKWGITPQHKLQLPKILLFDVETLPMVVETWGLWNQNIQPDDIIVDWAMLSWSAKWLYQGEVFHDVLTPKESKPRYLNGDSGIMVRDDKRITKSVWKLIDEADIVIAHNLKKFDKKKVQTRFLLHGMNPPSHYQTIDTLEISRREFAMSSNRLDFLGKMLVNDQKLKTDKQLWRDCGSNLSVAKTEALETMDDYCQKDVLLLEEVYLEIRKWIKSHPNLSLYTDACEDRCPNCGSMNLVDESPYVTPANAYVGFRCECGYAGRYPQSMLSTDKRKSLTRSVAR